MNRIPLLTAGEGVQNGAGPAREDRGSGDEAQHDARRAHRRHLHAALLMLGGSESPGPCRAGSAAGCGAR